MSQEFKQVPVRTAAEIVSQTERLAALLMKEFHGREATSENVLCHTSEDPRAQHAWKVACLMQIELTETDPDDALSELEEDEESLVAMPAQDGLPCCPGRWLIQRNVRSWVRYGE